MPTTPTRDNRAGSRFRSVAIVDCETTGLDAADHDLWEFAGARWSNAVDPPELLHLFLPLHPLTTPDPVALDLGGYHDRHPDGRRYDLHGPDVATPPAEAAERIARFLDGTNLVGAVPAFDERMVTKLLAHHGRPPTWHYRPVCVETLAVGYLLGTGELTPSEVRFPWSSTDVSRTLGVDPDDYARHTAMGDVEWAAALLTAVDPMGVTQPWS